MSPVFATDLVRSLTQSSADISLAHRPAPTARGNRRFIAWARTFLHLA